MTKTKENLKKQQPNYGRAAHRGGKGISMDGVVVKKKTKIIKYYKRRHRTDRMRKSTTKIKKSMLPYSKKTKKRQV